MTLAELQTERLYRIQERLGILCGSKEPTPAQVAIAESEANEFIARVSETPAVRAPINSHLDDRIQIIITDGRR